MRSFRVPSAGELKPKNKPAYSQPVELAVYSYDSNRSLHFDRSELKQYKPTLNDGFCGSSWADLNAGVASFQAKPQDLQEHLDGLIRTLMTLPRTERAADFVTWRGILTKMLCTPFRLHESWSFNMLRRGTTVFIEEDKSGERGRVMNAKQRAATYWGHRFEHMVMCPVAGEPSLMERFHEPVNTWREFGTVLKAKLGPHRLIFGAEVDGLDRDGVSYVELKTARQPRNPEHTAQFYQEKLIKFWAQSFLAGIERILVGFRSDRGTVRSLDYISVGSIPRMTRGRVSWCPEAMLQFGIQLLDWIGAEMKAVEEDRVFRLSLSDSHCTGTETEIVLTLLDGVEPFVPKEFVDAFYY